MTIQDYKDQYGYDFKLGSIVIFRDAGILHLGMIVEISLEGDTIMCMLMEADAEGRKRNRCLNVDIENGTMEPLLPGFADGLHTEKWDEWRALHV